MESINLETPELYRKPDMTGLGDPQVPWTPEEIDLLRVEWTNGLSGGQIGNLVNRTRNAVIGKANRLKLEPRAPRNGQFYHCQKPTNKQEKSKRRSHKKKGAVTPSDMISKGTKSSAPRFYPAAKPLTAKAPLSIMELRAWTCRAIVGHGSDGLAVYCGDATFADKSFCEGHCALYYDTSRSRHRA